jgi:mannosyltransferase
VTVPGLQSRRLTHSPWRELLWLSLLVWLAFGLRAWHLDFQSLWRDETDALRFAQAPLSELFGNFTRSGWNGPLYYILLRGWLALAGDSEFAARYASLLFGVLAVPLTWVVGRRMVGRATGIAGAALVALSPYLIWYTQELKMYALVLALGLFSTYFYRRALDEGRWRWWLGHVAITSLMMYTHILTVLILLPQALWFAVGWRRYRPRWRGWLVDMAALTLPYLPLAAWQAPLLFSDFQTGHPFYPLDDVLQILFRAFSRGAVAPWEPISMGVFMLCLLGGVALRTRNGYRGVPALALWLIVPLLSVYLISLDMPIFTDRYLIYVTPAYALLLARGLTAIGQRWRLVQVLIALSLLFFSAQGWQAQATRPIKSDFRGAAQWVAESYRPGDLIVFQIPYGHYTFAYYYRQPFDRADGLYTNHGMSEEEADRQMRAMTAGRATIWLVGSEMEMWDQRHLVLQWLQAHGRQTHEVGFVRVTVWRFEATE